MLFLGSSWKICRMVPLEPSSVGRFVEEGCCHPVWVMVETLAVADAVVSRFLLTEGTCRSRRSIVFGTCHGALVIILSILDWKRSGVSILESDAVPHSCIPYVHMGFRVVL